MLRVSIILQSALVSLFILGCSPMAMDELSKLNAVSTNATPVQALQAVKTSADFGTLTAIPSGYALQSAVDESAMSIQFQGGVPPYRLELGTDCESNANVAVSFTAAGISVSSTAVGTCTISVFDSVFSQMNISVSAMFMPDQVVTLASGFGSPSGLVVDSSGTVYFTSSSDQTIRTVTQSGVSAILTGKLNVGGSANGALGSATFIHPTGIAMDGSGNLYLTELNADVRQISAAGTVSLSAGISGISGHGNGTGGSATFKNPSAIAADASGNLYVADTANSTIRKLVPSGVGATYTVTTPFGLALTTGTTDAVGTAARFNNPAGIAIDSGGIIYVSDTGNHTIRKIALDGTVSTIAGQAGVSGSVDGVGTAGVGTVALFNGPTGIAVDSHGNLFVSDTGNSTIRKITPALNITTVAGTAGTTGSTNSVGATALFNAPTGIAVDLSGNVYVADKTNGMIRKIYAP